jgi:hypothetical protein
LFGPVFNGCPMPLCFFGFFFICSFFSADMRYYDTTHAPYDDEFMTIFPFR